MKNFELRLSGAPQPAGEIALADLGAISQRLQELSTKVSRWVAGVDGAGRVTRPVEQTAEIRFVGVREGSTVLELAQGAAGVLEIATPFESDFEDQFWRILDAMAQDVRPPDLPRTVGEGVAGLVEALTHAAPSVVLARADGVRIAFRPGHLNRAQWLRRGALRAGAVTVVGVLEMADRRSRRLRIADDVGHRIALDHVADVDEVAREHMGLRVAVTGLACTDGTGSILSIEGPSVERVALPEPWARPDQSWTVPEVAVGPAPEGGAEFDEDEWSSFLQAVRGT